MTVIREVIDQPSRADAYLLRPPRPGDLGWVVHRHRGPYAEEYGWDESFEALVARIVADYADHRDLRREHAWLAEADGEPVGCVFCTKNDDTGKATRPPRCDCCWSSRALAAWASAAGWSRNACG